MPFGERPLRFRTCPVYCHSHVLLPQPAFPDKRKVEHRRVRLREDLADRGPPHLAIAGNAMELDHIAPHALEHSGLDQTLQHVILTTLDVQLETTDFGQIATVDELRDIPYGYIDGPRTPDRGNARSIVGHVQSRSSTGSAKPRRAQFHPFVAAVASPQLRGKRGHRLEDDRSASVPTDHFSRPIASVASSVENDIVGRNGHILEQEIVPTRPMERAVRTLIRLHPPPAPVLNESLQ